jgi:hypothetical protein
VTRLTDTNETAADDERQHSGGLSPPEEPDEDCKHAVEQVKEAFAFQTQCRPSNFTPLSCRAQVVAGTNYVAKVDVQPCGVHGFAQLRIFKGLGEDVQATLIDMALDVEMNASSEYFGNETSEEPPGAAMQYAGGDTLGATLGWQGVDRRCGGRNCWRKGSQPHMASCSCCCSRRCRTQEKKMWGWMPTAFVTCL